MLENNAQNHQRDLAFRYKIKTKVRQSPIKQFFEVYVLASDDSGKAEKKLSNFKNVSKTKLFGFYAYHEKPKKHKKTNSTITSDLEKRLTEDK
jgi:hypothetical protein